jgi:hypothetical protein
MTHPCVDEVLAILGDRATARQIEGWIEKVKSQGYKAGELTQRVQEYGEEALKAAHLKKRNTALIIKSQMEMKDFIKTNFADNPVKGMQAYLGGIQSDKMGVRDSVYNAQEALERRYLNGIVSDLQSKGVLEDFQSGELDDLVGMELGDLTSGAPKGNATTSPKAKQIAEVLRKHMDYARERANAAGADIGDLKGYITSQTHDMFKIRKADPEAWINDVLSRIDLRKTFGDADPNKYREILEQTRTNFASGTHYKEDFGDPILVPLKTTTNIGGSLSKHRMLHFKDSASFIEYNKLYGKGSLRENIMDQMRGLANKTALMEKMGPNPAEVLKRVFNDLGSELEGTAAIKLSDGRTKIEKLMHTVDGTSNIPGSPSVAKWMQIVRAVQSMAKLGGAVVSAVTDIPLFASELKFQGHGWLDSYHNAVLGSFNNIPSKHKKELAMKLSVFFDGMNASMTHRLSGREDFSGASSRALGTFFKYSGLTLWTDRMRQNAGLAMGARLGSLKNESWKNVDDDLKRVLGLYNISEQDWPLLQKAVEDAEGGHSFMVPENIRNISDEDFISSYGIDAGRVGKAKDALEDKLRRYYTDRIDHAVINPDARTMAFLKQGTRPGTVDGEFVRLIAQFKAFPATVVQKTIGREVYGRGAGGWKSGSGMMGLAHTIAMTTAFGYISMSAKDILKGKEPRDPNDPMTWAAAMLQGGALGLYGDFLLGNSSRYGQSPLESLAGPGLGTLSEAAELLMAIRSGEDPSAKGFKFALANTPFANLFYTRAALDYLIFYRIQEMMSPGYLRRMEKITQDNNNQEFIVKPSSLISYGGQ